MSILQVSVFAFTLWMGLYTLNRADGRRGMIYIGFGLVIYAIALGVVLVTVINQQPLTWQPLIALGAIPFWVMALRHLRSITRELSQTQHLLVLAYVAAVFFLLVAGLLVIPQTLFSSVDLLVALSCDLVVMGYVLARVSVRADGEALLPHALRSLLLTTGGCILFGGQVALILALQESAGLNTQFVLLTVIASVIVIVISSRSIIHWVDRLIYAQSPQIRDSRETLREAVDLLAQTDVAVDLLQLSQTEFERLTRRALSMMNHPHRLVASPLMKLPLIDQRLAHEREPHGTLDRANALRALLTENIQKLKPANDAKPTITDEWRYYNALYYPYVLGIKPYNSAMAVDEMDDDTRRIIEWVRSQVPERTLHNWQNAGAKLVARALREQFEHG